MAEPLTRLVILASAADLANLATIARTLLDARGTVPNKADAVRYALALAARGGAQAASHG
ncbi:MAG: hypothetical protein J0H67_05010 [Rhodospirillales bacterium]|nr:hypothetical protein [Rhodospirillales bacterium]